MASVQRIGLIADTHGVFDPEAASLLKGVQLLLHAGDVGHHGGHAEVLRAYAAATGAPTLAVWGNVDARDPQLLPQHRLVTRAGWRLLLHHIVAPGAGSKATAEAAALIRQHRPDVVVCGHSHKAACWEADGVLFVNPGSAGPARFKLKRSVAVLHLPPKLATGGSSGQLGQDAPCSPPGSGHSMKLQAASVAVPGRATSPARHDVPRTRSARQHQQHQQHQPPQQQSEQQQLARHSCAALLPAVSFKELALKAPPRT